MNFQTTLGRVLAACILLWLLILCGCQGLVKGVVTPSAATGDLKSINHIIFMAQENRSFDNYFGQLPAYWAANGYPQTADGMPANASNSSWDGTGTVAAFHVATECTENLSPSWDESHLDWNRTDPLSSTATMDGFVYNAAQFARDENTKGANPPYTDIEGRRAMGYYDSTDLNYYYFMASNFATSDRWFSPVMDRTQINRMYLFAATSRGYAYPPGTNTADNGPINVPTIFDELTAAGISWKIYVTDASCSANTTGDQPSASGFCTYLSQFTPYSSPNPLPPNVVAGSQFLADARAGTLPAVAFIETGYLSGEDEHPSSGTNVQTGAAYVQSLVDGFMGSPSWKDSAFILTYDEAGGLYDHVPPIAMPNPDGVAPVDLMANDICTTPGGVDCNFNSTGYRVPMMVISPFTKKNYVSHTPTDYTAILKLIEMRFGLPNLNERDKAQMDMTEFFDFQNVPWATPPGNIPTQFTSGACNYLVLGGK